MVLYLGGFDGVGLFGRSLKKTLCNETEKHCPQTRSCRMMPSSLWILSLWRPYTIAMLSQYFLNVFFLVQL